MADGVLKKGVDSGGLTTQLTLILRCPAKCSIVVLRRYSVTQGVLGPIDSVDPRVKRFWTNYTAVLKQFRIRGFSQTLARSGEMPAKYFRLPSATHGGLSLRDQGSENNGETSVLSLRSRVSLLYDTP